MLSDTDNHMCNLNGYYRRNEVTVQGRYMYGVCPNISIANINMILEQPCKNICLA